MVGPEADHFGNSEGFYMTAFFSENQTDFPLETFLKSPYILAEEHPIECLTFWVAFSVI